MGEPHELAFPQIGRDIEEFWAQATHHRNAAIDEVCEWALQAGICGVSVYTDVVFVDITVPYGHINFHQCAYHERDHLG